MLVSSLKSIEHAMRFIRYQIALKGVRLRTRPLSGQTATNYQLRYTSSLPATQG